MQITKDGPNFNKCFSNKIMETQTKSPMLTQKQLAKNWDVHTQRLKEIDLTRTWTAFITESKQKTHKHLLRSTLI